MIHTENKGIWKQMPSFLFEKEKNHITVRDGETIEFSVKTRFCFQKQIAQTEFFEKDGFFETN